MEIYWAGRALGERKFALASVVEVHVSSAAENMTPFSKQNILRLQNLRNWLVFFPLCTHLPLSAGGTEAVLPLNSTCQHKRCFGDPKDSLDLGLRHNQGEEDPWNKNAERSQREGHFIPVLTAASCTGMMKRCSVSGNPCEAAHRARGPQLNECSSPEAAL